MTALVIGEAAAILLLGLLVAGLLRSHAEILRALHQLGVGPAADAADAADAAAGDRSVAVTVAPPAATQRRAAADITGTTPESEAVSIGIVGASEDTVLAFLSSGCHSCQHFWDTIGDGDAPGLPAGARVVIVTKDPADESLSKVRALATGRGPVVMSTAAWVAYEVPVAPYFLYVHGASGRVLGEGAAGRWEQVMSLLGQAIDDAGLAPAADDGTRVRRAARRNWLRRADAEREARVDADLEGAGIRPGDPSLYPTAADPPARTHPGNGR